MTTYLDQKVSEALTKASGNHLRATKLLVQMASEDELLYAALTQPFLHSGAALAVQRQLHHEKTPVKAPVTPINTTRQSATMHQIASAFGKKPSKK